MHKLYEECKTLNVGESIEKESISFAELFHVKYPESLNLYMFVNYYWKSIAIYAKLKKDVLMKNWVVTPEGKRSLIAHSCKAGTRVIVLIVTRTGDIGVSDNLDVSSEYSARGLTVEDLYDWEFVKISDAEPLASKELK